jgi:hypothetical protein
MALQSPLLSVRREINDDVARFMTRYKSEIMAAIIKTLNESALLDQITPKKNIHYRDGIDGATGPMGPAGRDGIDGRDGINGIDGKTPSPEEVAALVMNQLPKAEELKPDAIVDKVNAAETKINLSAIAGLEERINNFLGRLAREQRGGGGGGMGNVIHESFTMNGSDTSVTLANNVAAGGNAIWIRYQGQSQDMDTHFTVSGKTVSFTFTPLNGKTISITYIRS